MTDEATSTGDEHFCRVGHALISLLCLGHCSLYSLLLSPLADFCYLKSNDLCPLLSRISAMTTPVTIPSSSTHLSRHRRPLLRWGILLTLLILGPALLYLRREPL